MIAIFNTLWMLLRQRSGREVILYTAINGTFSMV